MRRACAWCGRVLPPSDEPPAPGLPADIVSHGMCEECLAKCMKELDADAGNEAGSASSPGPASHDTMGSRHRRPGDSLAQLPATSYQLRGLTHAERRALLEGI